ncbi:hypothetical protein AAHA92_15296 [Salvia divinorum]|uniref:Reverse transcriptase zinc-binding domain-containing protein n=1 Tax=Salvia divinorum TaxID=28513 RepID=A0ABD1HEB0_SALDI
MIVATWNVREMQQLSKQAVIADFVRKHKIDMIGLLETKLKAKNYSYLMKNRFKEWKNIDNFNKSDKSRMLLLWNPSRVALELINVDVQTIHTKIRPLSHAGHARIHQHCPLCSAHIESPSHLFFKC